MEHEKPFKTIEVIDSRTNQVCKVACMSCIRGHRTTSCGIPVCRTKMFWTVKRPGRPSNSCTCRYGATGGCKCVVARSACPHKSKKGEKRAGECRCDEQGRYCCLLEPEHWNSLLSMQKPVIEFFSTREALEAKQLSTPHNVFSPSPGYSVTSPGSIRSVPSTPAPSVRTHPAHIMPAPYNAYQPPQSSTLTPRFGMMGIGASQRMQHDTPLDPLVWKEQVPIAPMSFDPIFEDQPPQRGSCCQSSNPVESGTQSPAPTTEHGFLPTETQHHPHHQQLSDLSLPRPYNTDVTGVQELSTPAVLSPPPPPAFDFNRLQQDYFNYQFPSAICQNCGLSGCTCKNCPPVFQNYGTGSWAQCCGRKHAREVVPTPVPQKMARTEAYDGSRGIHAISQARQEQSGGCCGSRGSDQEAPTLTAPFELDPDHNFGSGFPTLGFQAPGTNPDFAAFDLDHQFAIPDDSAPLDINEFLLADLDAPSVVPQDEPPGGGGGVASGGSGECCCGG